jgi:hypothetical protein
MGIVLVAGALANKHLNGGAAWTRLSWIRGFQKLGFDVYFVEQIASQHCVGPDGLPALFEQSENRKYFNAVVEQMNLGGRASLICDEGREVEGLSATALADLADASAFVVNISGHLTYEPVMSRARCRVYIDLDPGFTQFWSAAGAAGARLGGHHHYFTVGENIGSRDCSIPLGGINWRPIRQPVVLEDWPVTETAERQRFTTIGTWRGPYGPVEF